ncbi:hypothetical protein [Aquisalimonas sp.]|uniref:hypothetical protein n=1 Tax=unclassified Aquisalimonas TaxID=2644645 RepID=UPI0025B92A92|nr:hypothetical protein [Aquisalimonas sp.]
MNIAAHPETGAIRPHNAGPSAVWSSGGAAYDEISRGILDAIEHTINRLRPAADMRILDVASGTGWAARRERLQALLGDAFDVRVEEGTSYYREPSGAAAWHTFAQGYGPVHGVRR